MLHDSHKSGSLSLTLPPIDRRIFDATLLTCHHPCIPSELYLSYIHLHSWTLHEPSIASRALRQLHLNYIIDRWTIGRIASSYLA